LPAPTPMLRHATANIGADKGSGVGGREQGYKRTPKSFDLVKIRAKPVEIWVKWNLWKPSQNLWKSGQTPWKHGQNIAKRALICKTWRSTFAKSNEDRFTLLEVIPKKVFMRRYLHEKWPKIFSGKFGEIQAKILRTPKNFPAPTPTDTGTIVSEKLQPQWFHRWRFVINRYWLLCIKFFDSFTYFPLSILNLVNLLFHALFCWKWPESCHVFVRWPIGQK